MNSKNFTARKGKFDAGHRVMHERFQCFNVHGHEYRYELTFSCSQFENIGYTIDYKEIKRVGGQWINDFLDHSFIANPADAVMIDACNKLNSKLYIMSLRDSPNFCNPTAENIAKEIFFAISTLINQPIENSDNYKLKLVKIKLYETMDCFVVCKGLEEEEWDLLLKSPLYSSLIDYRQEKGTIIYDDRENISS